MRRETSGTLSTLVPLMLQHLQYNSSNTILRILSASRTRSEAGGGSGENLQEFGLLISRRARRTIPLWSRAPRSLRTGIERNCAKTSRMSQYQSQMVR
jgi:hypothetical protein